MIAAKPFGLLADECDMIVSTKEELSMGCKWKTRRAPSHLLVWDATCPAQSHRSLAVHSAGGIAAKAEDLKRVSALI